MFRLRSKAFVHSKYYPYSKWLCPLRKQPTSWIVCYTAVHTDYFLEKRRLFHDPERAIQARSQAFKRWITESIGQISIQWITHLVSLILIHWIVIYLMDNAIQRLNKKPRPPECNNSNNELYLHDHTNTYSIAKAMFRNQNYNTGKLRYFECSVVTWRVHTASNRLWNGVYGISNTRSESVNLECQ